MSVNISIKQLQDKKLMEKIHKIVEKNNLDPQSLKLVITESMLMEDIYRITQLTR